MPRSTSGTRDDAFLDGAGVAAGLLRHPSLAGSWTAACVLPEMSVGALACHLARQVTRAAELLAMASTLPVLDSVDEHYARAAWVTTASPHDPANDRSTDDREAARGHAAMLEHLEHGMSATTRCLRSGTAPDVVDIPWQGWALRRPDFLHTRLLEIVVHTTDLAASLDVATPEFPETAFGPVRDLLVRLAVRRHGQAAVVGTLTRRERARNISAF